MLPDDVEKHLLAGLDDQHRGFSRQIEIEAVTGSYCASLRYEKLFVASDLYPTREAAVLELVRLLHTRGYSQLRSRLSFRGTQYMGTLEPWVEYPDPELPPSERVGFAAGLQRLWQTLFSRQR